MIVLSAEHVREAEVVDISLVIIHEAAHARIAKAGVHYWPDLRQRIESRCILEEMGFCRRLEAAGWGMDKRIAWYEHRLSAPPYPTWSVGKWTGQLLLTSLFGLPLYLLYTLLSHEAEAERRREAGNAS
jgi:hypothetical protein